MIFLTRAGVKAFHDKLVASFGGGAMAVRDANGLASALARPQNYLADQDANAALTTLAALYGHGIARSHAFADGNKRTAWIAMCTFLRLNGILLRVPDAEAIAVTGAVAEGSMPSDQLASYLENTVSSARP